MEVALQMWIAVQLLISEKNEPVAQLVAHGVCNTKVWVQSPREHIS